VEDKMARSLTWRSTKSWLALLVIAALTIALVACNGDDDDDAEPTATEAATQVATSAPTEAPTTAPTEAPATPAATEAPVDDRTVEVAAATISLDGQMDDWDAIDGIEVPLTAIPEDFREEETASEDHTATLKMATDGVNLYVLVAVEDGFSYDVEDHRLSPALGVEWPIDDGATPQMGSTGDDLTESSGMVDIWHWELDCGPGLISGGTFPTGNDPVCNLDDEYATLNDEREDDDIESSLSGSWDHTARAQGIDADGIFVFEVARRLNTGDPQDAQFELGGTSQVALAYWDGNEGSVEKNGGWSDAGHAVSVAADEGLDGWIDVVFPADATRSLTAPAGVTITLDGQQDDWAAVPGIQLPLTAIPEDFREEETAARDLTATLKVATDADNIYVLVAVPDGFSYVAEDHRLSPALGVEWQIDDGATPQMGSTGDDLTESSGMVDIWHWELDCGPGEISGGVFPTGNDPDCNLDDEYATLNDEREDDDADSSLTGSWDHTARAEGIDANGIFVFEIARPLDTGDPQDAQFTLGGSAKVAVAYWDGNEGAVEEGGGWTDAGHAVSITVEQGIDGWVEVNFE
jgi:hypothetical protein